jgi:hypothetical protein
VAFFLGEADRPAKSVAISGSDTMGKKTAKKKAATRKATKRASAKPTKKVTKRAATEPTKKVTKTAATEPAKQAAKPAAKPELIWVVWQDATGVWLGTREDFHRLKRPEAIVCDVLDAADQRELDALHRAVQIGQVLRQKFADLVRPWLQYDDAAQEQRIKKWEERSKKLTWQQ